VKVLANRKISNLHTTVLKVQ